MNTRTDFFPQDYGAAADGRSLDTAAVQAAVDAAAECGGRVVLKDGVFLTGSIFLKSNMEFYLEEGAELRGAVDDSQYPLMPSRVAGVEITWPAGLINVRDAEHVTISGKGLVNGQGEYWWDKFWGQDEESGMMKEYIEKGIRWAADYDCMRPRNFLIMNSRHIQLKDFSCIRSGFWNVHICYCEDVVADGLNIRENYGPSTDGIDIDSCSNVLVQNCTIACNDDSVCIKSGRDADGLRVSRVCENITIRDCHLLKGSGITLGSETSGGIRNILIQNIDYRNTGCGFRMKSARTRGGVLENITVDGLRMTNVSYPFNFLLDWFPEYSYCRVPDSYQGPVPEHWKVLTEPVPEEKGIPTVRNVTIRNVTSLMEEGYAGISRAFDIAAYEGRPMENFTWENVTIEAKEFGRVKAIKNWTWNNCRLSIEGENNPENDFYAR